MVQMQESIHTRVLDYKIVGENDKDYSKKLSNAPSVVSLQKWH